MKFAFIFCSLVSLLLASSCSTEAAEKTADLFHQKLDAKDYDYIINNLVDYEGGATIEEWENFLNLLDSWGPQKNRSKQFDFSKKTQNGLTTVKLSYTFEVEKLGLVHERLVLVKREEGYKLLIVSMNSDEAAVEQETQGF